jgi:hypothetical protein
MTMLTTGLASSRDNICFEIKLTNIMTGACAKYIYYNDKIKVYQSRDGEFYRLLTTKKPTKEKRSLINNVIIQLLNCYNYQSSDFLNDKVLDGYKWSIIINYDNKIIIYNVLNCYNSKIDQLIKVINESLIRKSVIFETGLMYNTINSYCELP